MAALEKLAKALDALKISKDVQTSAVEDDTLLRRKKKIELCVFVAETMCTPNVKNSPNFTTLLSFSMETLLELCDDPDSNIRLVADESLNRIIRAMMDNNVVKVHIELHKEIKKNGSVRSLRAALSRFAKLAHMIRPQKGKAYVENLVPCLMEIAKRPEETVLETLAAALPQILAALGSFITDSKTKELLECFFTNLSSNVPVVRRTAAESIISICLNSRRPSENLSYVISMLQGYIRPLDKVSGDILLGALNCTRLLVPHLLSNSHPQLISGDNLHQGVLAMVYEACLRLTEHVDHNIVTTALETLHQLILSAPSCLLTYLLNSTGLEAQSMLTKKSVQTEVDKPNKSVRHDDPVTGTLGHNTPLSTTDQVLSETMQPAMLRGFHLLVTKFLEHDTEVRVSVRALAMQCVTQLIHIHPQLFFHIVDTIIDTDRLTTHSDPQLRGLCRVMIGTFVGAALKSTATTYQQWSETVNLTTLKPVTLSQLLALLVSGLGDTSSVCVRHTLSALSCCLGPLLNSCDCNEALPILPALFVVANNPYWLVKVNLLHILGNLPYLEIYKITGNCEFQTRMLFSVMLALLEDEDSRVRKAASDVIAKSADKMIYPVDENVDAVDSATSRLNNAVINPYRKNIKCVRTEKSLSRIVHQLTRLLLQSSSKHLTAGCCEALSILSMQYSPVVYTMAWHSHLSRPPEEPTALYSVSGLLGTVIAILTTSPVALDLEIQSWLLSLAGNLFTGLGMTHLKHREPTDAESQPVWSHISDPKLGVLGEVLVHHLMRLLCVYVRVVEDTPSAKIPNPSPLKRRTPRASSPAKVNTTSTQGEKEASKEEKGKFGEFVHLPHCNKLFENLRSAYASYKSQLESGDKLVGLLSCVLVCLGQVLDLCTMVESGRIAEELLQYLRTVVTLEPTASVNLVKQMLKSLFGTNLVAQWEEAGGEKAVLRPPELAASCSDFYNSLLQDPLSLIDFPLSQPDSLTLLHNKYDGENMNQRKASAILKGSDRQALASYIRLFEPMVIQALKQYTLTNNVHLQVSVLSLLTELVLFRVNYCLLDSDQIFIDFVLKQFEFMELGQINNAEVLVPKVFEFLVQLSHEKHHSKPVISVAKVIQLCDGLMASGQDPLKYCIPALRPIVEHVFTSKGSVSAWQVKAMRDVVLSMLLRLVEYPQVLGLLSEVLSNDCSMEECKRWSHQSADVLMPLLAQGKVRLSSIEDVVTLLKLINSFLPRTLSPPDPLLRVLFSSQLLDGEESILVAIVMYSMAREKEHSLLARLEDLKLTVREHSDFDPLNASAANLSEPPHTILARLLVRILNCLVQKLHGEVFRCYSDRGTADQLQTLLAYFLITCCFIVKSCNHQMIAGGFVSQLTEMDTTTLPHLNHTFVLLCGRCPIVVILWCRLLSVISQGPADKQFWAAVTQTLDCGNCTEMKMSLRSEVVQRGSLIVFCDYIVNNETLVAESVWLLSGQLKQLMLLHDISPVRDYLEACKNCPHTHAHLLPSLLPLCDTRQPKLLIYILGYLASVSLDDSGLVLKALSPLLHHPCLVLARRAAALACSRVEYLLVLETEEVAKQFSQEDLLALVNMLMANAQTASRHSGLVSLLKKLSYTHYHLSLNLELNATSVNIHPASLDKAWFLTQVRVRCCQVESAQQCSHLLSHLEYADIVSVLRSQHFNNCILQHCFSLGTQLTIQERKSCDKGSESHLSPLYLAALATLMQHIRHLQSLLPRIHQVYNPVGRQPSPKETKYTSALVQLLEDPEFLKLLLKLMPAVVSYLCCLPEVQANVPENAKEDLAKFGVLCAEVVHWLVRQEKMVAWPRRLQCCLQCAVTVLSSDQLLTLLGPSHIGSVSSALAALKQLATGSELSLPTHKLTDRVNAVQGERVNGNVRIVEETNLCVSKQLSREDEEDEGADSLEQEAVVSLHTRHQTFALFSWMETTPSLLPHAPAFVFQYIRQLVMSVGRHSMLWWYSCTPSEAWTKSPTQSPLPTPLLQDVDLLRQLVYRLSLVGWTSRTQFEETWMCLLTVLNPSPGPESSIMQSSSVAVQAITSLLVQTLLTPTAGKPNTGSLLHASRNKPLTLPSLWGPKLEVVMDALYWKLKGHQVAAYRLHHCCNVERLHNSNRYSYGQVSVDFLKTAVMSAEEKANNELNADCVEQKKRTVESGLDLQSCVQFLLDLYSQWTQPEQPPVWLGLLVEVVRSTLSLSDLFCERSHFAWLLEWSLALSTSHPAEDHLLHQYLVVAACKAAAILPTLEEEVLDRVLRLVESSLKSQFLPTVHAAEYGLLYLLENFIHTQVEEVTAENTGLNPRQRVLNLAKDHLQIHFTAESLTVLSEDRELVMYSIVLYMLEHVPKELPLEVQSLLLQLVITTSTNRQIVLYQALVQGLTRLVLVQAPGDNITGLALDRLNQSDPAVSLPALQLLLTCLYSEELTKMTGEDGVMDPEQMLVTMEKTSSLFDKVKKGSPLEVESVCVALPFLLADFFPASEVLTKVIGEFLSPHQPNHMQLSAVVFQVLSQACQEQQLSLLQAWLVMSLHIFTQTLPVVTATWYLSCFFISASTNPWLRAIFPHVQSRLGKFTHEDRKLLCIAASDFYRQLQDPQQKETFHETFKEAASTPQSPFADIISYL